MAKKKTQSVPVVLADGKTYNLRFDFNSLITIEQETNKSLQEVMENSGLQTIRVLLYAALLHENPEMTVRQAGALVDLQTLEDLSGKINEAVEAAFGGQEKN